MKIRNALKGMVNKYNSTSLILRIVIGLIIGTILGLTCKNATALSLFGDVFVGALKAVAPVLVFVLVISALAQKSSKLDQRFGMVIFLYMLSTFLAAVTANIGNALFPQTVKFPAGYEAESVPQGIGEIMKNLITNIVGNPVQALCDANYICILFWAIIIGLALKAVGSETTSNVIKDIADAITVVVRWIINMAPFGIFGITFTNISTNGISIFKDYGQLLLLLVGCMLAVALIVDPLIISIPLGATINMDGAAITISIMSLTAANTLGIHVDFATGLILCVISALGAAGTSGVAGGSLMLIPMACSLFGITNDTAMQMVAIGFICSVIQDSLETALNSSGDVMFTATAEYYEWEKQGRDLPYFLGGNLKVDV